MDTSPTVCIVNKDQYNEAIRVLSANIKGFKAPENHQSIFDIAVDAAVMKYREYPFLLLVAVIVIILVALILQNASI